MPEFTSMSDAEMREEYEARRVKVHREVSSSEKLEGLTQNVIDLHKRVSELEDMLAEIAWFFGGTQLQRWAGNPHRIRGIHNADDPVLR